MKDFFKGVRKHIDKLDAEHLREQYSRLSDEVAFLDTLFSTLSEGLVVVSAQGEVVKSNLAARQLLGMEPAAALPTLELPLGVASRRELAVTYPEARTLEVQTAPVENFTLVVLRDLTAEKRRKAEELQSGATSAVRQLASGVAHEIGNPLNALSLNLQLLKREHPEDEAVDVCLGQIRRLDGILKGFLQALRPSRPNLAPGSVADPLKRCLKALGAQFEEHRITVTLEAPAALPPVALDAGQLEQVFFNLLKNALEALYDGGKIGVRLGSDDNFVTVAIRDNGAGMDAETLAHLFEPYQTSKEHGTGLGLMISQRIVRDHGGTIAVESRPGAGTVFTVRLPRLERRIRELK